MDNILIIIHFLAMAVGIGGSAANMILGIHLRGLPPEAAPHVGPLAGKIGRAAFISLLLLWITGFWMVERLGGLGAMPAIFWAKIIAVVLLTLVSGYAQVLGIRHARAKTPMPQATAARIGHAAALLSTVVVVFAVISFH